MNRAQDADITDNEIKKIISSVHKRYIRLEYKFDFNLVIVKNTRALASFFTEYGEITRDHNVNANISNQILNHAALLGYLGQLVMPLLYNQETDALKFGPPVLSQIKDEMIEEPPREDNSFASKVKWAIRFHNKSNVIDYLRLLMLDPRQYLHNDLFKEIGIIHKIE